MSTARRERTACPVFHLWRPFSRTGSTGDLNLWGLPAHSPLYLPSPAFAAARPRGREEWIAASLLRAKRLRRAGIQEPHGAIHRLWPHALFRDGALGFHGCERQDFLIRFISNSGTWRPYHELIRWHPETEEFVRYDVMAYLAFFKDDENQGRAFESWCGVLGPINPPAEPGDNGDISPHLSPGPADTMALMSSKPVHKGAILARTPVVVQTAPLPELPNGLR